MHGYREAAAAIQRYERKHRNPDRPRIEVSGLYDLFPDRGTPHRSLITSTWHPDHPWPHATRAGIYVVLDDGLEIRYVGKAVKLGARLSAHFAYRSYPTDQGCRIVALGWSQEPRFVMTAAVPDDSSFEAASLEEYLIQELQPPDNTRGKLLGGEGAV